MDPNQTNNPQQPVAQNPYGPQPAAPGATVAPATQPQQPTPTAPQPVMDVYGRPQPVQPQQPTPTAPQPVVAQPQTSPTPEPAYATAAPAQPAYDQSAPAYGQPVTASPMVAQPTAAADHNDGENPAKSYLVTLLVSYLFGSIGIDRFYLGKTGTAFAKLFTFGGLGIWSTVDIILVAFGKLRAKGDDRPLSGYNANRHWVKIVAIVLIVLNILVAVLFVGMVVLANKSQAELKTYNTSPANQSSTSSFDATGTSTPSSSAQ